MMRSKRKLVVALFTLILLKGLFVYMIMDTLMEEGMLSLFMWGIPVGCLFGLITCIYLSIVWDAKNLRPISTKASKLWIRVLGIVIFVGMILPRFLSLAVDAETEKFIVSYAMTWVVFTLGYMVVKVSYYHLR